jgi:D-amino-acid dehydrogenase
MKVVVMGAGVIGVSTAYYLARGGHEVTVIERRSGPGLETSFANGGQIAASHAEPWANPATPLKALKWLGKKDAPLLFHFRFDTALWSWTFRFLANCTAAHSRANTERTLRVALYSRACLKELRTETGIEYDQQTRGVLHFYRKAREYDHALREAERMNALGCRRRPVTAAECAAIEPALAHVEGQLAGGILSPDDESGDAYLFTVRLAARAAGLGAVFRYGVGVLRLNHQGKRITGVETDQGTLTADAYVLALGPHSAALVRPLGLSLPIYPAKGYSVTMPILEQAKAPLISLTDDEHKLVFSRLGNNLRVAGTAEFTGYDTSIKQSRTRPLLDAATGLFPGAGDPEKAEFWAGLRPKTPDSVPLIGRTPFAGLYLNTGHGTLGWTMACGSGRIVADLIGGRKPDISLDGLGLDRFARALQ